MGGVHLVDEEVDAVDVGERGRERARPLAVARGLVAAALPPPRRGQVVVALAEGDGVRDVVRVGVDVGPRDLGGGAVGGPRARAAPARMLGNSKLSAEFWRTRVGTRRYHSLAPWSPSTWWEATPRRLSWAGDQ